MRPIWVLMNWNRPELRGTAATGHRLNWTINVTLPATPPGRRYESPGTVHLPITGLTNTLRAHSLTGLDNYTWYTVTLSTDPAAQRSHPLDADGQGVYLPLILR